MDTDDLCDESDLASCEIGCQCLPGYARDPNTGDCVLPSVCVNYILCGKNEMWEICPTCSGEPY